MDNPCTLPQASRVAHHNATAVMVDVLLDLYLGNQMPIQQCPSTTSSCCVLALFIGLCLHLCTPSKLLHRLCKTCSTYIMHTCMHVCSHIHMIHTYTPLQTGRQAMTAERGRPQVCGHQACTYAHTHIHMHTHIHTFTNWEAGKDS